jgi:large subunit ribosomal protein L25
MAKQIKLTAQARSQAGRNAVKKIKSQGLIPAVIYGGAERPQNLQVVAREMSRVLSQSTGEHFLVDLQVADGGQVSSRLALVQEVQHHPVRGDVVHVDFHAVDANKALHAEVSIEVLGEASGVKNQGGLLELNLHAIEVECLPKDLPEVIQVDVAALSVGDAIHIRDLALPAGVVARGNPDLTVVHVAAPKVESESAAGAPTEPEVLKEKKQEAAADKK